MTGESHFHDNATFDKDVTVKGNENVEGDLTVSGTITGEDIHAKGKLVIDGTSEFNDTVKVKKDLEVEGETKLKDTTIDGDLTINGTTTFHNDVIMEKDLYLKGQLFIDGEQHVTENMEVDGDIIAHGNTIVEKDLTVQGETHLKKTYIEDELDVTGESHFHDNATFDKDVTVNGNQKIEGELDVDGSITGKDITAKGNMVVEGDTELKGNTKVDKDLTVDGTTYLNGDVVAGKDLRVVGDSNLEGNVNIGKDLTVDGKTVLRDDLVAEKNVHIKGDTTMDGSLEVNKNMHVVGETQLDGNVRIGTDEAPADLGVTGNVEVNKNLTVKGDSDLQGDVYVGGDLHAENGTSYFSKSIWNEGQENQVEINETGIRVGLNSTHMDAHGVYAGGHNWDEAKAAMNEDGRIKGIYGTFEKDVEVGGNLNVKGNANVVGDANIGGSANIVKDLHVGGNSQFDGDAGFNGNVVVAKDFAVLGNAGFAGNVGIEKNLMVNGDTIMNGNAYVKENLLVDGNIKANGTVIADNVIVAGKDINSEFSRVDNRIDTVGANAAALAGLHPTEYDEGQKWSVAAAMGNYKGEKAGAVGIFYRPDHRFMASVGGTFGNDDGMMNVGVSYALQKGTGTSKSALQQKVKEQDAKIANMEKMIQDMAGKLQSLTLITDQKAGFPDVPKNHWANNAVETLHGNGFVQGYPDGQFKGDQQMTRYEYAEMLYNALAKGAKFNASDIREYAPELKEIAVKNNNTVLQQQMADAGM